MQSLLRCAPKGAAEFGGSAFCKHCAPRGADERSNSPMPHRGLRAITGGRSAAETSCGAAIIVKPKVRLCEPWVMVS